MIKTEYQVSGPHDLTIAVVADLHEYDPRDVLTILRDIRPDVITVPGDLFENYEFEAEQEKRKVSFILRLLHNLVHYMNKLAGLCWKQKCVVEKKNSYEFLEQASKIAPVLTSLGNHERYLMDEDKEVMDAAGIRLLNNSFVEFKGVLFGGIPSKRFSGGIDTEFLKTFAENKAFKVLLCHHPEYYETIAPYSIDLILSGHAHGGQIRIGGRGVFSPGQGLFPKYHHGIYDGRMIVSAGCSNTASIPRWGNECEVVVVRIKKEQ